MNLFKKETMVVYVGKTTSDIIDAACVLTALIVMGFILKKINIKALFQLRFMRIALTAPLPVFHEEH